MTPEEQKYFETYFDLFAHEGWAQLVQELTNNAVNINNISATKDAEDLAFRKGQLNLIGSIVNLKETVEATYKQATEEVTEDA